MLDIQKISSEKPQAQETAQTKEVKRCSTQSKGTATSTPETLAEDAWAEDQLTEDEISNEDTVTTCQEDENGNKITTVTDSEGKILSKQTEKYDDGVYCGKAVSQYTYDEKGCCLEKQSRYDENGEFSSMDYITYDKYGDIRFRTVGVINSIGLSDPGEVCIVMNQVSDYELGLVLECYPNLEDIIDKKFYDGWNIFGWETGIKRDERQDAIIERIRGIQGEE